MNIRRWGAGVFVVALLGCDPGTAPKIEGLVLTRTAPRRYEVFYARVIGSDVDGDLEGGTMYLEVEGSAFADTSVVIEGLPNEQTKVELSASVQLVGPFEAGRHRLRTWIEDASGNDSNELERELELR